MGWDWWNLCNWVRSRKALQQWILSSSLCLLVCLEEETRKWSKWALLRTSLSMFGKIVWSLYQWRGATQQHWNAIKCLESFVSTTTNDMHWKDKDKHQKDLKSFKKLERMLVSKGSKMKEVEWTKDADCGPKHVFSIRWIWEIVSVDGYLCNGFLNY